MRHLFLALGLAALGLNAIPATAQDLTDEQILKLFEAQRDAFHAATTLGGGKTRGLTIVTVDDLKEGDPGAGRTSPDGASTQVAIPGTDGGTKSTEAPRLTAGTTIQPATYGSLDKELQVNVRIHFGFDSASLTEDQKPVLAQMCSVIKQSDIKLFRIVGHTDSVGSDAYNEHLSQLRAEEVRRHLIADCGIAPDRLEATGMGKRFPYNTADPKSAENRRVEFQALS